MGTDGLGLAAQSLLLLARPAAGGLGPSCCCAQVELAALVRHRAVRLPLPNPELSVQRSILLEKHSPPPLPPAQVCAYYTAIVSLFTLFGVLIIPDVVRHAVVTLCTLRCCSGPCCRRAVAVPHRGSDAAAVGAAMAAWRIMSVHVGAKPSSQRQHSSSHSPSIPSALLPPGSGGRRLCEPASDGEPVGGGAGEDAQGAGVSTAPAVTGAGGEWRYSFWSQGCRRDGVRGVHAG